MHKEAGYKKATMSSNGCSAISEFEFNKKMFI